MNQNIGDYTVSQVASGTASVGGNILTSTIEIPTIVLLVLSIGAFIAGTQLMESNR